MSSTIKHLALFALLASMVGSAVYFSHTLRSPAPAGRDGSAVEEGPPVSTDALPPPCLHNPFCSYEKITAIVGAYTKIETCPGRACVTARGTAPLAGRTIACPRRYPFGAIVLVGSVGYICEDRTARRFDGRFDIYFGDTEADYERAIEWGIPEKEITIEIPPSL